MAHHVYILHSNKLNRFYIGESSDVVKRLLFHENSEARKFTAKAKDWKLYLKIACENKKQALGIETHLKNMKSSTYIENLKKYPEMVAKLLQKYKDQSEPQ